MRTLAVALSLFLTTGVVFASPPKGSDPAPARSSQTSKVKTAKKKEAGPSSAELAAEIQQLKQALQTQQSEFEQFKNDLAKRDRQLGEARDAAAAANSRAAEAVAAAAGLKASTAASLSTAQSEGARLAATVGKVQAEAVASKKDLETKIKGIGPFTFSGDLRLRDEPFFGGPANQSQVRNRERFRLRVNINTKLNDDISGGFALASGDINDPISTNQTTNQFYTRKSIGIDRVFVTYTPHQFKSLLLTGGKFAYPFYRTELTWDNDLNPEGLAQTLQWNWDDKMPFIRRFALVGFELPFTEVAGVSAANKSIVQSAVYGGQVQAVWQSAGWLKLSTYGTFYNYHNADPIALAVARASLSNPTTPGSGALPLGGNSIQNSVTTTTSTSAITVEQNGVPTLVSTGVKTVTNAQFASKFALFDGIARFDINTGFPRLPLVVLGDYVQNTRACANVANIIPLPPNTATAIFTQTTNAACNSRERRGYWLEGRAGRLSNPGDFQVAYTRMMIEREAVMTAFDFSDLRQASNLSQHRLEALYQVQKNIQLGFTGLFGRPLNFGKTTPPEPLLKRLQFDAIYKF